MIYGMDYLGGAKYGDLILKYHPKGWAAGFFAQEFGPAFPVVKALSESGKCPLIRIQMLWSGVHSYGEQNLPLLRRMARNYERLSGHSRIQLSPFCEHNLKNADRYLSVVREHAPSCEVINTPWKGGFSKVYNNESHTPGYDSVCQQFSFDGIDTLKDPDYALALAKLKNLQALFLWTPLFNCKESLTDKTPIEKRKARPTRETINSLRRILEG